MVFVPLRSCGTILLRNTTVSLQQENLSFIVAFRQQRKALGLSRTISLRLSPYVISLTRLVLLCLNADGTLNKRKSRLVARGNEQSEGVDFVETYSHVVRIATIRSVLHIAMVKGWNIKQLDVENVFLHGDLKETVYMKQPPGIEDTEKPHYVCKLRKDIYGLRQSSRAWFDKFSTFLLEFGFKCNMEIPLCLSITMVKMSFTSSFMLMICY